MDDSFREWAYPNTEQLLLKLWHQLYNNGIESADLISQGKLAELVHHVSQINLLEEQAPDSLDQENDLDGQINTMSTLGQESPRKRNTPRVMAVYTSTSPIFYMVLIAAGIFVLASPITQFFVFGFFNGWSLTNFSWWVIEFSIGIYVLLIVLPNENLQKIFLWASHYVQGVTIALLFLNIAIFMETMLIWIQEIDLSNVFKNDYELTERKMANFEIFQTLPTIGYLFLVYFFIVDIREFYTNQDGTVAEVIISIYTIKAQEFLSFWINWINNFLIGLYTAAWLGLNITITPIIWFNIAVQWTGEWTLKIVKIMVGWFEVVFLWWYQILVVMFNWVVPIFQWFAQIFPAPKWPDENQ